MFFSLPTDELEMPSIGNGQLATGIYTDTVYMNGLYNGEKGESHRARIPSQINIRMDVTSNINAAQQRFILDTEKGQIMVKVAYRFYVYTLPIASILTLNCRLSLSVQGCLSKE